MGQEVVSPSGGVAKGEGRARLGAVDTAKCIGIVLMVWGHTGVSVGPAAQSGSACHMPLFFILAGFVAGKQALPLAGWGAFVIKKVRGLLVPYFLFTLIFFFVEEGPWRVLLDIAYGSRNSLFPHSSQMWFLPCLFVAVLLFQLCINLVAAVAEKRKVLVCALLAAGLFFLGALLDVHRVPALGLPFGLNVAFMGTSFMFLGWGFRWVLGYLKNKGTTMRYGVLVGALFIGGLSVFLNRAALDGLPFHLVSMATAGYGNPFLFYLTAGLLSLGVLLLSDRIQNPAFNFIGRNTLFILCTSPVLTAFAYDVSAALGVRAHLEGWRGPETVLVTAVVILLSVPLIYLVNWLVPNLVGKQAPDNTP